MSIDIQPFHSAHRERCYEIFAELDHWFGSDEINLEYTQQLDPEHSFVALVNGRVEGIISTETHFDSTVEIYSMAVSLLFHRCGIGKLLLNAVESEAQEKHYDFLHVKTLGDELPHPGYKKTRLFYEQQGFIRLFQTTELWDGLPTMLYVKSIR